MSLRTDYDAWHGSIYGADPEHEDASSPWYRLVREKIGNVAGQRILEIACGRGGFSRELSTRGASVTGCDFSFTALRVGTEKLKASGDGKTCAFVQGDAQVLPFANESFDTIVSCETIEHVPDVKRALREMWRVAKPGGKLLLTTPNYANLMGLYDLYARVRHPRRKDDQPFDRRQWFLKVRNWVKGAGWSILHSDGTVHQLPVIPGHNPVRVQFVEASKIVRRMLSPIAFTYFLLCEKRGGL
jgi:SAM-dependent methyltransferase